MAGKKGMKRKPSLSLRRHIQAAITAIMRRRGDISLLLLHAEVMDRIGVPIRKDYLLSNLIGMRGVYMDCESASVWREPLEETEKGVRHAQK